MVKDLGIVGLTVEGWEYINTTGDPYYSSTKEQQDYGSRYLLPFSKGESKKVMWEMLPDGVATIISFIRCIPSRVPYNDKASVVMMPGDRCILIVDGNVIGYNDAIGCVIHLVPYKFAATKLYGNWRWIVEKLIRYTMNLAAVDDLRTGMYGLWPQVVAHLISGSQTIELTSDLQSRLQWELRMRAGA